MRHATCHGFSHANNVGCALFFCPVRKTMMRSSKRPRMGCTNHAMLNETILQAQKVGAINWPSVIPAAIADFLEIQGHSVSSSPEQVFMGLLAVFPGLLSGKTKLVVRPTYKECQILYSVCLADPGAGKSAAFDVVTQPLDEQKTSYPSNSCLKKELKMQSLNVEV